MRAGPQGLFPMAVLAMLAALTFWLDQATRSGEVKTGKYRHDPDFTLHDFTVKKLGKDGNLKNLLAGKTMTHYPDDEITVIEAPSLTYLGGNQPLHLRAGFADIGKDGKEVILKQDVLGWRDPAGDTPGINFSSSSLTVYPDDDIAQTNAPVTITRGKSVLRGVGMDLDNKLHLLSLRSQVRGTIQPRK